MRALHVSYLQTRAAADVSCAAACILACRAALLGAADASGSTAYACMHASWPSLLLCKVLVLKGSKDDGMMMQLARVAGDDRRPPALPFMPAVAFNPFSIVLSKDAIFAQSEGEHILFTE